MAVCQIVENFGEPRGDGVALVGTPVGDGWDGAGELAAVVAIRWRTPPARESGATGLPAAAGAGQIVDMARAMAFHSSGLRLNHGKKCDSIETEQGRGSGYDKNPEAG